MPMKDRTDGIAPRQIGFPLLGKLFKGAPKRQVQSSKTGKTIEVAGKDLTFYRVHFALEDIVNRNAEEEALLTHLKSEWRRIYGDEPRRFSDVRLLADTPDKALTTWYQTYGANGLMCQCDGEMIQRWLNPKDNRMYNTPLPCPRASGGTCECKPMAKLPMVLMRFSIETGMFGYFSLTTHSHKDVDHLYASLWYHYQLTADLTKITWILTRRPENQAFVNEKGERASSIRYFVQLYGDARFTNKVLGGGGSSPTLPPPPTNALPEFSPPPLEEFEEMGMRDETPSTPRRVLSLREMDVRTAFLKMLKAVYDQDSSDVLEAMGVRDFRDLEWYQVCEKMDIELDPPAELYTKKGK